MSDINITLAVKASPEAVWAALTDGAVSPAYYLGFQAEFDLTAGAPYRYSAGGGSMITGTVTDVQPLRTLVTTFNGAWDPAVAALPESEVTFELIEPFMPMPGVTFLSCTHRGLPDADVTAHLELGWVAILSGLKTLLETGAPMVGAPA
ncbi:MAG: SRPBCC domain-containing protein [Ilumatobacteraceae bacterium]